MAVAVVAVIAVAALLRLSVGSEDALAWEAGDFNHLAPTFVPDKNEVVHQGVIYYHFRTVPLDVDEDGSKETSLSGFKHPFDSSKRLLMYRTNGRIWGWAIFGDVKNKPLQPPENYSLANSDGRRRPDGGENYDRKYRSNEDFPLPAFLKPPGN